jgi:anti-anti-sigma regulatory factor
MEVPAALILHAWSPVGLLMTLRIFVEIDEGQATVALHGRLTADEVPEVEKVASSQDRPLRIDLAQLTSVDSDGLQALRRLCERGARVTDASPFIEMMLERTTTTESGQPGSDDGPLAK